MTWRKVSNWCITSGDHKICKVIVNGVVSFELWTAHKRIRAADTAQELKDYVETLK